MDNEHKIKPVGLIHTVYKEKFGVPRQAGLADTEGYIELLEPYNDENAVRGLDEFSHIWLIWGFSQVPESGEFKATVRPPRLGGNERVGVFASRSPFRPNRLGLSLVRLGSVEAGDSGTIIRVQGADLVDETPIYDIKPYIPYVECVPDALAGFVDTHGWPTVDVCFENQVESQLNDIEINELKSILSQDPRPRYQDDEERVYGMLYRNYNVKFKVKGEKIWVISL